MSLNDAEIGIYSLKLKETIRAYFLEKKGTQQSDGVRLTIAEQGSGVMDDSSLADMLLTAHPNSLDELSPEGYAELTTDDKYSIIERALEGLERGNGLVYDRAEDGLWLQVAIMHEGRTPLGNTGDYRFIRLSSIDQVIPKVALGVGQDSRGWGWNLLVTTNGGETFYASDRTYRGQLIQLPQSALMSAISSAVKAETQPDALPKLA